MTPTALIVRTAGTNCDVELAHAFALAGANTRSVHINELIEQPRILEEADLVGFPGGFSYGDDIAAGRIFANRLRQRIFDPLRAAVSRGVPMIGICNGFQVLVKLGLLPDPDADRQTATLADNTCGRFVDRWVSLRAVADSQCVWTHGLEVVDLPIAHGEGRFVPESNEALQRWRAAGQIALRYVAGGGDGEESREEDAKPQAASRVRPMFVGNPNGSVDDIAGVCDPSGLVLGLMPHPERHVHETHHPHWARRAAMGLAHSRDGLRFFENAIAHVRAQAATMTG